MDLIVKLSNYPRVSRRAAQLLNFCLPCRKEEIRPELL